jgi:ABC-2 type transport system permease protein
MAAKLAALTVLAVAAAALALTSAAMLGPGPVPAAVAAQLALVGIATMWCGFGFGLLLLASAPAIVAYYVVPIAWSTLGRLVPALSPAASWLDMSRTQIPLTSPDVTASEWARFAVSALVWVAAPIALGLIRTNRAEVS